MVVPRGVLRSVRYGAVAIAVALALWSSAGLPGWHVRQQVSALPSIGEEVLHGWRSLRRWALRGAQLWRAIRGSPGAIDGRDAALLVVRELAAHAPQPSGALVRDASTGALFA